VLIRRALEAICADRGITKGCLKSRLDELVRRGEIPLNLIEAATILRSLGNEGAHGESISPYTTWVIADFFKAIVEYIYVAPNKVETYKRRVETTELREQAEPGAAADRPRD
jgi:hypothetical protein